MPTDSRYLRDTIVAPLRETIRAIYQATAQWTHLEIGVSVNVWDGLCSEVQRSMLVAGMFRSPNQGEWILIDCGSAGDIVIRKLRDTATMSPVEHRRANLYAQQSLVTDDPAAPAPSYDKAMADRWYRSTFPGRIDPLSITMARAHKAVERAKERGFRWGLMRKLRRCGVGARTTEAAHRLAVLAGLFEESLIDAGIPRDR